MKKLDDRLWELRCESRTNIYRIMYLFFTGRLIVLLQGFQKKTQETPRGEIEIARRRLNRYSESEGGEGHGSGGRAGSRR